MNILSFNALSKLYYLTPQKIHLKNLQIGVVLVYAKNVISDEKEELYSNCKCKNETSAESYFCKDLK